MENLFPVQSSISTEKRSSRLKQKPCLIWFTGLSGSGKSSLALMLEAYLFNLGYNAFLLDADNVRRGLNKDLSFSDSDRQENIRRVGEVANLMMDAGIIVIAAFISPFKIQREALKIRFGEQKFVEIFVDCPSDTCQKRDTKGLYNMTRNGQLKNFTGIDSPYEPPSNPDITLNTNKEDIQESFKKIIPLIIEKTKL